MTFSLMQEVTAIYYRKQSTLGRTLFASWTDGEYSEVFCVGNK